MRGKTIVGSDLRMGRYLQYVFHFVVAKLIHGALIHIRPERLPSVSGRPGDTEWLVAGITGIENSGLGLKKWYFGHYSPNA